MSQRKLVIMVGPSGSGKSTAAKSILDNATEPTIILNRDKLREMLFGYTESSITNYYRQAKDEIRKCEAEVTKAFNTLLNIYMINKYNVIIDNTNLNLKRGIDSYKKIGADMTLVVMNTHKEEAMIRNTRRNRIVDRDVIEAQYLKFDNLKKQLLSRTDLEMESGRDHTAIYNYN